MKTWYVHKRTYDHTKYGEKPHGPSMTIPGETRTIQELMDRYAKTGTAPYREGVYFDQPDLDYINQYYAPYALDLTDIDGLKHHASELQKAIDRANANKAAQEAQQPPKPDAGQQPPAES